jgi:hypothetical protein
MESLEEDVKVGTVGIHRSHSAAADIQKEDAWVRSHGWFHLNVLS